MAVTAATSIADARALLNDPSGAIYKDAPMIKLCNKVYKELQVKMDALGAGVTKEISAVTNVLTGVTSLSDGAGLPADMISPLSLAERLKGSGSSVFWDPMDELDWEPELIVGQTLRFWAWREEEIKFLGATTDREVKIRYNKGLTPITATTSPILILDSDAWLAQRLAAVAALVLGSNPTRASALMADLTTIWDDFKSVIVRRKQGRPVRRRRTRYRTMS
jgi:hypothetical protein